MNELSADTVRMEADYIVVRPAADLPAGFLPADLDGKWFDRSQMTVGPDMGRIAELGGAVAVPTDRFEVRADGAVAQVWEIRP